MTVTAIDELLNRRRGDPRPVGPPDQPRPRLGVTILTCMDTRIDVPAVFGLAAGEVHILRNAGGVATDDAIRSLSISQRKLGTREVLVMQHTECGMSTITEDGYKDELQAETGLRPAWAVQSFRDVHDSVRQSVAQLRASPFLIDGVVVRGFVYDVRTGALTEAR